MYGKLSAGWIGILFIGAHQRPFRGQLQKR